MQFGKSGHQFLPHRQDRLAGELFLSLRVLFGLGFGQRRIEPGPNAADLANRTEAAKLVEPIVESFEIARPGDLRPQRCQLVDKGVVLLHPAPGETVRPDAAGTRYPIGRTWQVTVDAGEDGGDRLGRLRPELRPGPVGIEIGDRLIVQFAVGGDSFLARPAGLVPRGLGHAETLGPRTRVRQ